MENAAKNNYIFYFFTRVASTMVCESIPLFRLLFYAPRKTLRYYRRRKATWNCQAWISAVFTSNANFRILQYSGKVRPKRNALPEYHTKYTWRIQVEFRKNRPGSNRILLRRCLHTTSAFLYKDDWERVSFSCISTQVSLNDLEYLAIIEWGWVGLPRVSRNWGMQRTQYHAISDFNSLSQTIKDSARNVNSFKRNVFKFLL